MESPPKLTAWTVTVSPRWPWIVMKLEDVPLGTVGVLNDAMLSLYVPERISSVSPAERHDIPPLVPMMLRFGVEMFWA